MTDVMSIEVLTRCSSEACILFTEVPCLVKSSMEALISDYGAASCFTTGRASQTPHRGVKDTTVKGMYTCFFMTKTCNE